MKHASVLIVEDEAIVAKSLEKRLVALGYTVAGTAATGTAALRMAARFRADLVLLDIRLRGTLDGIEIAHALRDWFRTPVIFLTAYSDSETIERAGETGPYGYLLKPFGENDLISAIKDAVSRIEGEPREDLSGTLEMATVPMAIIDPDTRIILGNLAFRNCTGYSLPDARENSCISSLLHHDDITKMSEYLRIFQIDPQLASTGIEVRIRTGISGNFRCILHLDRIRRTSLTVVSFTDIIPE
ncbi:MAG: response regulator [Methanoregulaceae archaeon]